ncbi:MFS transporter [Ramlibacter albus]|uniref:MFS transporter n=1 Tax=Ramlibacter albus TaxID=2079448 RepID=A0A923M309_9BURK|nr:MFS transporter [Ramlibacter albus]MBC5763227.1 MFS transporter [Ramlibacter albus]
MHPPETQAARAALLKDRNFRWLVSGGTLNLLGDQFTLIALPWLVLKMTGDTLVLGTVLALIAVPRALFILVGGAVVDRYSPKRVNLVTKYVNTLLLAALALGVFTGKLTMPIVYVLALGIGVATAFSIPSGMSLLPRSVAPQHLAAANGIMMGLRQLSFFVGPLLAGLLIALFGDGSGGQLANANGIALAFGVDSLSFAVSAWTLWRVTMREAPEAPRQATAPVVHSILEGLRHVGRDAQLRTCFLYWAAIALLVMGPLHIALPVLASSHPELGASALGIMAGAHGFGTLTGMVVAGAKPGLRIGTLGTTVLIFDLVVGVLFMPMGHIGAAWQGALLMALIGVLGGSMQVAIFTWLQRRVPPAMLGRAMSLFMFIFMGLVPMASAVTGVVLRFVTLQQLFVTCGGLLVAVSLVAFVASPMRAVSDPQPVPAGSGR